MSEEWMLLGLNEQFLSSFVCHLTGDPSDPLAIGLRCQSNVLVFHHCQNLCLKYLIGSVAIHGKVGAHGLNAISKFCGDKRIEYVTELVDGLARKDDPDTVAQFVVDNINCDGRSWFNDPIMELIDSHWNVVEKLFATILNILRGDQRQKLKYYFMLQHLPAEVQYEEVVTSGIPRLIDEVYFPPKSHLLLRRIFFLARCSSKPSPQLRIRIAERHHHYRQFLPVSVPEKVVKPRPGNHTDPNYHVWDVVTMYLDTETSLLVWPRVCKSWSKKSIMVLTYSSVVHDMYLQDLNELQERIISKAAPWNYCLVKETTSQNYLGHCILSGAVGRVKSNRYLRGKVDTYLKAVIDGKTPVPGVGRNNTLYNSFLELFDQAYKHCSFIDTVFNRPKFLSEEEYEGAIRYLLGEKERPLALPESWLVSNIIQLFEMIGKKKSLMMGTVYRSIGDVTRLLSVVIMHGQAHGISEELATFMFSQFDSLKKLITPTFVSPSTYYDFIVEHDMLLELAQKGFGTVGFNRLLISLILSLKREPEKIDRIVKLMTSKLLSFLDYPLEYLKGWLGTKSCQILRETNQYSPEDVEFFEKTMLACGLLEEPTV